MAAVTAAVAGVASAAAGIKGARDADKAQRRAERRLSQGMWDTLSSSGPFGQTLFKDGKLTQTLSPEMADRMNMFSNLGTGFLDKAMNTAYGAQAGEFLGLQGEVAGMQPDPGSNFLASLQSQIGGNMGLAQGQIGDAFGMNEQLQGQAQDMWTKAQGMFDDIGNSEQARSRQLELMRERAQPYENRAATNLFNKLHSKGILGSSGGALQMEGFATGLGRADLDRQLAASEEGRRYQQNAMNLGMGFMQGGNNQLNLGQGLIQNAFRNFGNFAGMASDVEGQRFSQEMGAQNNLFNQLGSMMQSSMGIERFGQQMQSNDLGTMLSMFGAAQAIPALLAAQGQQALNYQGTQSNAAIGAGSASMGMDPSNGMGAWQSAFAGLGQAAQGGGFDWLGNLFSPTQTPTGGMSPVSQPASTGLTWFGDPNNG